ncbi:MAG: hypothetical protein Q8937_17790 [Bacteroidota bacterium]|nr:hypothetical protein [Bacteroidota bacterium]
MILKLLILILVCCGTCCMAVAQQNPIPPPPPDTAHARPDSARKDSAHPRLDSSRARPDSTKPEANYDSLYNSPGGVPFTPITLGSLPGSRDALRADSLRRSRDGLLAPSTRPGDAGHLSDTARPAGFPTSKAPPHPPTTARRTGPTAPLSNLHRRYIPVRAGLFRIDSTSLIPGAFSISGIPDSAYTLDWVNGTLAWKRSPNLDSVLVQYRTFPYRLNSTSRRFNHDSIANYFLVQPYVFNNGSRQGEDNFFNFGNITYNGSFGRSISFGNSQDAVVTSNLNLQISGYLADSIRISAAITDNNIPIQPDGTTANLNEFDKIFLQFSKRTWALSMGDIDLRQNQNYFLNFYKRLQGASFETTNSIGPHVSNHSLASAAIAKGKFTRNIFQGQEGNQGPYKLQGASNELYFIVLAGTEKVYIDGRLMQRGEDQDYVINYNTGEVTFTANRMITQDARIQVEFEYADRNYLNVNLYFANEATIDNRLKLRVGLFSNSDSRNSPINQTLDPDQQKFLSRLGDSIAHAYFPVATLDTPSTGKILYRRADTTYKNASGVLVHDSIYIFSADPSARLYNLAFANVGAGYGNYVPDLNGVNGNVFVWVAPVNGVMQGSYEAAQFLVTPKTQTVMTVGADYKIDKNTAFSAELAKSRYDVNTLSSIDKGNDKGYAAKFQFTHTHPLGAAARGLNLTSNLGYEYVQASFIPLEPLRPVEFTRDWGLGLSVQPADERIYTAAFLLSDKKQNSVKYEIDRYDRGNSFVGIRNILSHTHTIGTFHIADQVSLTTSDSSSYKGSFLRPSIDISKRLPFLKNYTIGAGYSLEDNEKRDKATDTLSPGSYAFQNVQAYLRSPDKDPNRWGITFSTRANSYAYGHSLIQGDRSKTFNFFADLTKNPHDQFHITATYRNLQILRSDLTTQTADNSVLGRAEYIVNEWKGFLKGNMLYEVGAGQEQKKNYTYLQVPAGTGQYAWIDVNHDGIQQLSEFVLAQFSDQAQYIKVFTPTNEYVKANYNTFNYGFTVTPKALINPMKAGSFGRFLARVTLQASMQLTQKQQASGFLELNPFKAPLDDTSLITRNLIVVNTVSFNRSDPHWGFDVSNTRNGAKTLLTYGYESKQLNEWMLRTRVNMSRAIALNATFRQGSNQLFESSSNFDSSNYNLRQFSLEPALSYTRGANFRIGLGYKLSYKMNAPELGDQHYTSGAFNSDFKYNIVQSTSVQAKFTVSSISYMVKDANAVTTSSVAYTMLEGLLPGKNYLWSLDFTKRLGSNLELNLQYEGRKAGTTRVIHTGRASLRALL